MTRTTDWRRALADRIADAETKASQATETGFSSLGADTSHGPQHVRAFTLAERGAFDVPASCRAADGRCTTHPSAPEPERHVTADGSADLLYASHSIDLCDEACEADRDALADELTAAYLDARYAVAGRWAEAIAGGTIDPDAEDWKGIDWTTRLDSLLTPTSRQENTKP